VEYPGIQLTGPFPGRYFPSPDGAQEISADKGSPIGMDREAEDAFGVPLQFLQQPPISRIPGSDHTLVTGVGLGALYFLVASGLSLIYGLMHGALVCVSHDREFLDGLCTRIVNTAQ
jgi:hypothetical protein